MVAEPGPARHQVGRGNKVRVAVFDATIAELIERGFAALTVESVARRAGVHKTTVYRRWADRYLLVLDALTDRLANEISIPDARSLEADLNAMAHSLIAWLDSAHGRALITTLLAAANLPEFAQLRAGVFSDRLRRAEPVVQAAIGRGELSPDVDPAEVIRTLVAPIYLRLLLDDPVDEPTDSVLADKAVAVALAAARSGALDRRDPTRWPRR